MALPPGENFPEAQNLERGRKVYQGLRQLSKKYLDTLPEELIPKVADISFAFFNNESPVTAVVIEDPAEEVMRIKLEGNDMRSLHSLSPSGENYLHGTAVSGSPNPAYRSGDFAMNELGAVFFSNFDFYQPILEASTVRVTIRLSQPRE